MAMEQTTIQKKQQGDLFQLLFEKEAEIKGLHTRVEFLETRLEQRSLEAKKDLRKLLPYFADMRKRVMRIFMDMPNAGLSRQEIIEEFRRRFPRISTANIPRRVRECVTDDKKLWSKTDEQGTVRFYLRL